MKISKRDVYLLFALIVPIYASGITNDIGQDIERATAFANANKTTTPSKLVELTDGIATQHGDSSIELFISKGSLRQFGNRSLLKSTEKNSIIFQDIKDGGYRALIHISSPKAPLSYEFKVLGASQLVLAEDGSVEALDQNENLLAIIKAPWAKDANGLDIPTYFQINDTTLTQVVEHRSGQFIYGVVADPFWIPAAIALRACLAHPVCKQVAKQGTKAAIKWAMDKLF